jgi:hypothetical protein
MDVVAQCLTKQLPYQGERPENRGPIQRETTEF